MRADRVPVIGARDCEEIIGIAFGILRHEVWCDVSSGPTGCRMMIHGRDPVAVPPSQSQDLPRGGSRTVESHVIGPSTKHLNGPADRLRRKRGGHSIITIKATTKASTKQI